MHQLTIYTFFVIIINVKLCSINDQNYINAWYAFEISLLKFLSRYCTEIVK